jgi:hypothetical protein
MLRYYRHYNRHGYAGYSQSGCLWLLTGILKFLIIGALFTAVLEHRHPDCR